MNTERMSLFLMANLGAEVSRLLSYHAGGDIVSRRASHERARRVIDALLVHPELRGRTGEILILRDVLADLVNGVGLYKVDSKELEEYFMPFAVRELAMRGIVRAGI